jgi:putative Mn2+ efflux pump MntP
VKNWIAAFISALVIVLGVWSLVEVARGTEAKAFEDLLWSSPPRILTRTLALSGGVLFIIFGSIELSRALKRIRSTNN